MIINNAFPGPTPFKPPEPKKYIRARVVVKDMYDQGESRWPNRFVVTPNMGDTVQSDDGRRLQVLEVIHSIIDDEPTVTLEIGVDKNAVTPSTGGGSTSEPY